MARDLVADLRVLVHDLNADDYQWTALELATIIQTAMDEVNTWLEKAGLTTYNSTTELQDAADLGGSGAWGPYNIVLHLARIVLGNSYASDPELFLKVVTQDTQLDPGNAGNSYSRILRLWQTDLDRKIDKWIGRDFGGYLYAIPGNTKF